MRCSACGCEIPIEAKFCAECGCKIINKKKKYVRIIVSIVLVITLGACGLFVKIRKTAKEKEDYYSSIEEDSVGLLKGQLFSPSGYWRACRYYNIASELMFYDDGTMYGDGIYGDYWHDEEAGAIQIWYNGYDYMGELKTDGEYVVLIIDGCVYAYCHDYSVSEIMETEFYEAIETMYMQEVIERNK